MTIGRTRASILIAGVLAVLLTASSAHAILSSLQHKCLQAVAKSTQGFVKGKLKLLQKCRDANLKEAGSCTLPGDPAAIAKLETKLAAGIDKSCTIPIGNFAGIGYPGQCNDANPLNGFTQSDLKDCILTSHETLIDQMIDAQYDSDVPGPLEGTALKCQKEISKQSAAVVNAILKNVQKCRNDVLNCTIDLDTEITTCKIPGISQQDCATDHPKTAAAITKVKNKALAAIAAKCSSMTDVVAIEACEPNQTTGAAAATCEVDLHTNLTDNPDPEAAADLIDYEYARPGICGDNILNNLNEECDGTNDAACPGQCGTPAVPDGFFACLCKTKPRMVIAEHSNADTDNGWLGLSVDGSVVEGGGYIVDLYDCAGGVCNTGPSCSLAPHSPCSVPGTGPGSASGSSANAICIALGQGSCRKERTATGPHCFQDINKKCSEKNPNDAVCNAPGDFCQTTFHGAPVAAAAGGVAVCNVSTFSEDVVGTVNTITGAAVTKVRQRAVTLSPISQDKPCPVCGGFCAVSRERCNIDADCPLATGPCVTAAVCSDGVRQDKPCRKTPPFGGEVTFFGITSIDCLPDTAPLTNGSGTGLDINANPRTTGTVTLLPSFACTGPGFTGNTCVGGTSEGRPCTVASQCPGGTCSPQCFCAGQPKPNDCSAACVGGPNDLLSCVDDLDCPSGFCHPADCRADPTDLDSNQEGICSSGPTYGACSITTYKQCTIAADCEPPGCPFCQPAETCDFLNRACFVNSGIVRTGTPGPINRETAAIYCVPSNAPAIDASAGFPGPGALIQREVVTVVP